MSALPPKADIRQRVEHVCFVPNAELPQPDCSIDSAPLSKFGDGRMRSNANPTRLSVDQRLDGGGCHVAASDGYVGKCRGAPCDASEQSLARRKCLSNLALQSGQFAGPAHGRKSRLG